MKKQILKKLSLVSIIASAYFILSNFVSVYFLLNKAPVSWNTISLAGVYIFFLGINLIVSIKLRRMLKGGK